MPPGWGPGSSTRLGPGCGKLRKFLLPSSCTDPQKMGPNLVGLGSLESYLKVRLVVGQLGGRRLS